MKHDNTQSNFSNRIKNINSNYRKSGLLLFALSLFTSTIVLSQNDLNVVGKLTVQNTNNVYNVLNGKTKLFDDSDYSLFVRSGRNASSGGITDFAGIKFGTGGSTNIYDGGAIVLEETDASNNYGDFKFYLRGSGSGIDLGESDEKMRITNDGRVGIGTVSPTAFLEVVGRINIDGTVDNNVLHLTSVVSGSNRDMLKFNTRGLHPYLEIYDSNQAIDIKFDTQGDSWFNGGNFGIGTTTPTAKLDIRGNVNIAAGATSPPISSTNLSNFLLWVEKGIVSEDFAIANADDWDDTPDYVFEDTYELPSLEELNVYVNREKHLPGIPGEKEIKKKNHYTVHEMLMGQLKNLEEQVLHNIRQEKRILEQEEQLTSQEEVIQSLLERIEKLEVDRDQ